MEHGWKRLDIGSCDLHRSPHPVSLLLPYSPQTCDIKYSIICNWRIPPWMLPHWCNTHSCMTAPVGEGEICLEMDYKLATYLQILFKISSYDRAQLTCWESLIVMGTREIILAPHLPQALCLTSLANTDQIPYPCANQPWHAAWSISQGQAESTIRSYLNSIFKLPDTSEGLEGM